MNILHVSSEKTWRGGEQQIAYLLEELIERHQVTCHVACKQNSAFETYCLQKNIPHTALPFANEFDLYTAQNLKNIAASTK